MICMKCGWGIAIFVKIGEVKLSFFKDVK